MISIDRLKEMALEDIENNPEKHLEEYTKILQQLDQLKAENEDLKNKYNILKEHSRYYKNEGKKYKKEIGKLKAAKEQAEQKLERIRGICKSYCKLMCLCETKETCESCINTEVLQIIDEVE